MMGRRQRQPSATSLGSLQNVTCPENIAHIARASVGMKACGWLAELADEYKLQHATESEWQFSYKYLGFYIT